MYLFILLIMSGAWLLTTIRLSILKRSAGWSILLLFTLPVLCFYELAAGINLKQFYDLMGSGNTLNTLCLLVIVQEALALVFGTILLRRYYLGKKLYLRHYLALLPSALFPAACFGGMVYIFNYRCGNSFEKVALSFIFGVIVLTGVMTSTFRRLKQEQLINCAATASLIQIFTAMFLPVVLSGKTLSEKLININSEMLAGLALLLIAVAIFAVLAHSGYYSKITQFSKRLTGFN